MVISAVYSNNARSVRRFLACALALFLVVLAVPAQAAGPLVVTPQQVHWMPGTGALSGTQIAVIDGNPNAPGEYMLRVRMPNGKRLPIHFHGHAERVTVLSGTLLVAVGDKIVPVSKMVALGPGSYANVPPGLHHYAMARGETIFQVSSEGPRSMTVVHR